jgi:ATP-binding cassette subfamily F protein 3
LPLCNLDLSEALDNINDPLAVVRAIRKLKHERLERALTEMKEIAARRSGARGAKSRKDLISLEERVANSKSKHVIPNFIQRIL